MNKTPEKNDGDPLARRIAFLEERVDQLESRIGLASPPEPVETSVRVSESARSAQAEEDLEFAVGQDWFAKVGIVVLTLGAGFTVSLPFARLPAGMPSLIGFVLAGALFALARFWRQSFELVSGYLRGGAMALLYFSVLRLFFFGPQPLLSTESLAGRGLLLLVVAFNLILGYRRQSPALVGLALLMGYVSAVAVGAPEFVLPVLLVLGAAGTAASLRHRWPSLLLLTIPAGYATYFLWSASDPILGHPFHFVTSPAFSPGVVLALVLVGAAGSLWRRQREVEDGLTNSSALLNCGLGYAVYFLHTLTGFPATFALSHLSAAIVFLGVAILFWVRERSRVGTFLYAMTGYMALSMAIVKAAPVPDVYVWLSVQSVVVVATAIWFRSRFIVVANFLIYAVIVLAYVFVAQNETGISVGFGLVALVSARILNWQKDRLELKTELMRNAYLLSAFIVFPFSLYHLVPASYVGLAWVGLALFYYLMNLVVRSPKFRWMGHATLLCTTLYLVVIGTSRFEPLYRVLSFLVLGTVLLMVSLLFTRLRKRQRSSGPKYPVPGP